MYTKTKTKTIIVAITLVWTTTIMAQTVYDVYPERVKASGGSAVRSQTSDAVRSQKSESEKAEGNKILTGFTGGMKLHIGYAFSASPGELFHNGSLQNISDLPTDGVTLGLGGELRLHLINHIHIGLEGGVSTMPLMSNGSSIRTGWGGVMCDYYGTLGKRVQLCIGITIGGGSSNRLYVPLSGASVTGTDATIYNASYTQTPFFMLDPYAGMEIALTKRIGLLLKVDYILPFGNGDSGITTETIRWSNFLSPSGPRLYVGVMFGRHDRRVLHL